MIAVKVIVAAAGLAGAFAAGRFLFPAAPDPRPHSDGPVTDEQAYESLFGEGK